MRDASKLGSRSRWDKSVNRNPGSRCRSLVHHRLSSQGVSLLKFMHLSLGTEALGPQINILPRHKRFCIKLTVKKSTSATITETRGPQYQTTSSPIHTEDCGKHTQACPPQKNILFRSHLSGLLGQIEEPQSHLNPHTYRDKP